MTDSNLIRTESETPLDNESSPVISVVTAVYNEEECIDELVARVAGALQQLSVTFEIIVVNDGSRDATLPKLIGHLNSCPELRVIDLYRNFGVMAAIAAGIKSARGKAIVVIDGDLQDPPELIGALYKKWNDGADVVYGLRTKRGERWYIRALISCFYRIQSMISDIKIPPQSGNFGLIDRRVARNIDALPERNRYFAGLRSWAGGRQEELEYERAPRTRGQTRQGLRGLVRHARLGFLSFSKWPLRMASLISLVIAFAFLVVGVAAVVIRLATDLAIPGWATFTALIGGMGFVHSLVLAIISEYLAAVFDEIKGRPAYLIRAEYDEASIRRSQGDLLSARQVSP